MSSLLPIHLGAELTFVASTDDVRSLPSQFRRNLSTNITNTDGATLASTVTLQINREIEKYLQYSRDTNNVIRVLYDDTADQYWTDLDTLSTYGTSNQVIEESAFYRIVIKDGDYVSGDGVINITLIEAADTSGDFTTGGSSGGGSSGGGLTEDEVNALIAAANRDQVVYKGTYNADTNVAYNLTGASIGGLINGVGTSGFTYKVVVPGTRDFGAGDIVLGLNDLIIYSDNQWKIFTKAVNAGVSPQIYEFTNINGETTGVTITHNSGHPIVAILVLDPLHDGDDLESSLIDEQDPDGNAFTANWLGIRSGRIIYYTSSDTSGVTAHQQFFTSVDGATGVTVTHNAGQPIMAILVLESLVDGGDLEISLIDEQSPDGNSFTANWLGGIRSGSVIYYK